MHLNRERVGGVLEEFAERGRSRMGDASRPPSPGPFVVVTEAATAREPERDLVRQNIGKSRKSGLLSHHLHRALGELLRRHRIPRYEQGLTLSLWRP